MDRCVTGLAVVIVVAFGLGSGQPPRRSGIALSDVTWPVAHAALNASSIVVIPLGGGAVEQGPHLALGAYDRIARYAASRVQQEAAVVVAPSLTYHFYPSFLEYAGSTSLTEATARDMTVDIVRSLAAYGPRRFYVLNIGEDTLAPLSKAAHVLADDGILLGYTDYDFRLRHAIGLRQAPVRAAHADEAETSMLLYVDPAAVDMSKAVREYGRGTGALTRKRDSAGTFSESGVIGDPMLATREEGRAVTEAFVAGVLDDIEHVRAAALPEPKAHPIASRPAATAAAARGPSGCSPSDERLIREVGQRFSYLWRQMDADGISKLFLDGTGDMRHPDGMVERGRDVIRDNRSRLFSRREYAGSVHPLMLNDVRCLSGDQAIADGKWELRLQSPIKDGSGAPAAGTARYSGWCTLVLTRGEDGWMIEAWRYTVDPEDGAPPPNVTKQPGFAGRGR